MTDYKDGDVIQVNGKHCRIDGGALVPVVKRGPLGGELKRIGDIKSGTEVILHARLQGFVLEGNRTAKFEGYDLCPELSAETIAEVNIPPRPTFTPMTAGEAAKLPDIVGRWVAAQVLKADNPDTHAAPLALKGAESPTWFDGDDQLLLIEGVDL